jgi:hypothetical protein
VDYTYSVAEGNASDPAAAYFDALSGNEPERQLVFLDWDQTHTLNLQVSVGRPGEWGISLIGQYGSGLPYTPAFRGIRTSFENSERKPAWHNLDLRFYRDFKVMGIGMTLYMNIYNLLDVKNENIVFSDTGRATYSLIPTYTGQIQGINTLDEYLTRSDYYSAPRQIKIGLRIGF